VRDDQYVKAVLEKCDALKQSRFWSAEPKIRPLAWLENFADSEKPVAAVLLDHFVFFSMEAVDRMLLSGYRSLRDLLIARYGITKATDLLARAVFTAVEGETPNVTDSGKLFCRKLRQILDLQESRFVEPRIAVQRAASDTPVIFLDDFVGSGRQFETTWKRRYLTTIPQSFQDVHARTPFPAIYLNLVTSSYGLSNIRRIAPSVLVVANHVVDEGYSVKRLPKSRLVPDVQDIQGHIDRLLDKYHHVLRLPTYFTTTEARKYGFHRLGLLLAFDHSTPDATVPLLWAEGTSSWTPLVRRV
jgi:hypothetical protein